MNAIDALARLPRLGLCQLPTPIHRLTRLERTLAHLLQLQSSDRAWRYRERGF